MSNYDKFPVNHIRGVSNCAWSGWSAIGQQLRDRGGSRIVIECYPGVIHEDVLPALIRELRPRLVINSRAAMLPTDQIEALIARDVTDDPVFGHLTQLRLEDFFSEEQLATLRRKVDESGGTTLVYGTGASLVTRGDVLVYADLARWEIQNRFRCSVISNLGGDNRTEKWSLQYKQAFFVDWRVADWHKKQLLDSFDYLLDTNKPSEPKLATGDAIRESLRQIARRPFRVVPFFDPAPWGGQWMKRVCQLDPGAANYGWCFDCVPEENSLLIRLDDVTLELPAIDLVFYQPRELLGDAVHARFGTEFPIRFDLLDTMGGGNLSLQVHPLTEYIQQHFGMHYTQDESYYLLDAAEDASVYLGLREGIDRNRMAQQLRQAQSDPTAPFPADSYVNRWPAKKHDHFLIPAGTIHCSGQNSLVLEISATPYIFTFKLWDWGRLGLDGLPRPIHLDHGLANIQWDRDTRWTNANLTNRIEPLQTGDGWREQRTGLHEREFIETRRHWFTKSVPHDTHGSVNVLNLVEGEECVVESPTSAFEPLVVHYAETFIVPAAVGQYVIRPTARLALCAGSSPKSAAKPPGELATIKAFVRT